MIRFEFITFLLCLCSVTFGYTQQQINLRIDSIENISIQEVFKAFEDQYQFDFSYDVKAIENLKLKIDQGSISIDSFAQILKEQTPFILQKVDDYSFILILDAEIIDICGLVIDAVSSFGLAQANIIKDNNVISLTDEKGAFRLRLNPRDSIEISYLGYKTITIKAATFSNKNCDTIRLQPEVLYLNEVIINEYLTTGVEKNKDASINVSTKKLRILPGLVEPDVLQSLQLLPGISSPTEDPAGLYIRGGTLDQNLVLWDGIKIYQTGHFFNQISTFNPYIVKNVKVYRGGTSVRYGDRVAGAIIIESDDDLTESLKVGGGVNFTHADIYAKVPLSKKIGVLGAVRRSTTDLYQNRSYNNLVQKVFQNTRADISNNNTTSSDQESREDNYSFSDSNFKVIWNPNETNSVKLSTIFSKNDLNNVAPIEALDTLNSLRTQDLYTIKSSGGSIDWEKKYSNNIQQHTTVYFSSFKTRYDLARNLISVNNTLNFDYIQKNEVTDIGASYSLDIPIAKKQSLALGYQYVYNETQYYNKEFFTGDFEEFIDNNTSGHNNNHTIYSEYNYKGSKMNTNIGLRGSYLSRQDRFFVEPRLFTSVEILKNFRITASAELKNQQINNYSDFGSLSPTIRSLPIADSVLLLSGATIRDNDVFTIPVIESKQYTVGTLYTHNGWNFDLEGYYKKLSNITSVSNPILEFISIGEGIEDIETGTETRIGFDFLLKKRINNYRFWLGYSLSKTLVSFPNLQESSFAGNFDQRHVFNISQTLKVKNFEFALGWNYTSGRPFTKLIPDENSFAGNMLDPNGINAQRLKEYHRLDASVVYRFTINSKKPWGGLLGFSLRNIYNRKNIIDQGFMEVGSNDIIIDTFERKSLRLTPDVVIRFNF